jgi:hypothetical protein
LCLRALTVDLPKDGAVQRGMRRLAAGGLVHSPFAAICSIIALVFSGSLEPASTLAAASSALSLP